MTPLTPLSPVRDDKLDATLALLERSVREFRDVAYSCSLGIEGIVLTDLIWTRFPSIEVFTLDTGRLHEETYLLLERLQRRYGRTMKVVYPDAKELEQLVARQGINGFYDSVENRHACCDVRKINPFRRAIAGKKAWITGVRREQSRQRASGDEIAWDDQHGLWKVSPMLDWTEGEIWSYARSYGLPYNALHDRGYPSIGCSPCTRAIQPGESKRAGRWWWESTESRECGLQGRFVKA